jgi:hypothetical protein
MLAACIIASPLIIYLLFRVAGAAWYKSKHQFTPKGNTYGTQKNSGR